MSFYYISKKIEKESVRKKMKKTSVQELVEEKLESDKIVSMVHKKNTMHSKKYGVWPYSMENGKKDTRKDESIWKG